MAPKKKKGAEVDHEIEIKHEDESDQETEGDQDAFEWWRPNGDEINLLSESLAKIQRDKRTNNLVIYADENPNPKKSKRIKEDIKKNAEILEVINAQTGGQRLGPKTKIMILTNITKINKKQMRMNKMEQEDWIKTIGVRLTNLVYHWYRLRKDPPKWMRKLSEGAHPEIEDEQDKPAKRNSKGSDQLDGENETKPNKHRRLSKKINISEETNDEQEEEQEKQYEVKFSEELMLPMRREQGGKKKPWETGCPIDVGDRSNLDHSWIKATWPDGYQATLQKTYGDLRAQIPLNSKSMDVVGSKLILEGTHTATNNAVKLDQRVDRKLLIVIYEQNRQILQCNVEEFGPCANGNQRLPETDETLIKAFDFMKPIYDRYIKDDVAKDELVNLKIKMLEERRKLPQNKKQENNEGGSTGSNEGTAKKKNSRGRTEKGIKAKNKCKTNQTEK